MSDATNRLAATLYQRLTGRLDLERVRQLPEDRRRVEVRPLVERLVEAEAGELGPLERAVLVDDLLDDLLGLGPLEKLLRDPSVSDVLVNGPSEVYVERKGQLQEAGVAFRDEDHLMQ